MTTSSKTAEKDHLIAEALRALSGAVGQGDHSQAIDDAAAQLDPDGEPSEEENGEDGEDDGEEENEDE
jgi:hypothetical protein